MASLSQSKLQKQGRKRHGKILGYLLTSMFLLGGSLLGQSFYSGVMAQSENTQGCSIKELSWIPQSLATYIIVNNTPQNLRDLQMFKPKSQDGEETSDLQLNEEILLYSIDSWMFDLFKKLPSREVSSSICTYGSFPRSIGQSFLLLKFATKQDNLIEQLEQSSNSHTQATSGYLTLGDQNQIPKYYVKALNDTYLAASTNLKALGETEKHFHNRQAAQNVLPKLQGLLAVAPQTPPPFWYYSDLYTLCKDREKTPPSDGPENSDVLLWLIEPSKLQVTTLYPPSKLKHREAIKTMIEYMPKFSGNVSDLSLPKAFTGINIKCKTREELSRFLFLIGDSLGKGQF